MFRSVRLITTLLIFMVLGFTLVACSKKVTQSNFEKIQTGMSMKEVVGILGEPSSSESFNFAGFAVTSASWKDKKAVINIQFFNDKVKIKSYSLDAGDKIKRDSLRTPDTDNIVNPDLDDDYNPD